MPRDRFCAAAFVLVSLLGLPSTFPPTLEAAPDFPFFGDDYRGNPKVILAYLNNTPITERDLYVFLLLARQPNPALARRWNSKEWAPMREERVAEIARAVELLATVGLIGPSVDLGLSPYLQFLRTRWTLYPVYTLVWTDEIVAPEVQIYPEDVLYYIREHRQQFFLPERLQFYWAWFPSATSDSPEKRLEAKRQAEEVARNLKETGASLFTVAADYPPSTTLTPEEGLYTVPIGSIQMDPLVEAAVREDPIRQASAVIETRDGFHLVEPRARLPAIPRPEDEIRVEARTYLFHKFLPQQFDHKLREVRGVIHPVDRTPLWSFLADDTVLLDIGRTDLTKEDFRLLFPDLFGNPKAVPVAALRARAEEFTDREVVAQDVEAHLLDADSNLVQARPMARAWLGTQEWIRQFQEKKVDPATSETQQLWTAEREKFWPAVEYRYYRLGAGLPASMDRATDYERAVQVLEMKRALEAFREEMNDVLASYRASTTDPGQALEVSPIVTRWQRRFGVVWPITNEDVGFRSPLSLEGPLSPLVRDVPRLEVGEVSRPRYEAPGVLAMYFVTEKRVRPEPSAPEIQERVIEYLKRTEWSQEASRLFQAARADGRFRWAPGIGP